MKYFGASFSRNTWGPVIVSIEESNKMERKERLPIAFPAAQEIKVAATTVDFFVAPAIFRDIMERARVCADQKERVI